MRFGVTSSVFAVLGMATGEPQWVHCSLVMETDSLRGDHDCVPEFARGSEKLTQAWKAVIQSRDLENKGAKTFVLAPWDPLVVL